MKQFVRGTAMLAVAAIWFAQAARADVVLSGPDSNDGSYSSSALAGFAAANSSAAVVDSTDGYDGVSVWGLLGGAPASSPTSPTYGGITTSTPVGDNGKNAILRYFLVATDAAGNQSVVSLGEIDPSFGGTGATPAYIAYATTPSLGVAPSLIVPGQPGRDLTNVTSLQVLSVPALPTGAGGTSGAVTLSGNVTAPSSDTQSALQTGFTPQQLTVGGDTYTGVPLYTFIDPTTNNVNQIVVAQATDGYEVVYALGELDPSDGGNANDLLPYADTGTAFPGDGVARTITPLDNKQGRWVSNLASLQVETVPEPGTLPLMGVALAGIGLLRKHLRPRGAQVSPV
jgi:hypothetical protein